MSSPVLPMTVSSAVREVGGAVEVGAEAAEEAGPADAAGECRDAHGGSLVSPAPVPASASGRHLWSQPYQSVTGKYQTSA